MLNNIKIIGDITNITSISRYNEQDTNLILSNNLQEYFGEKDDYIEYYVYDIGKNILNYNYNYFNYKLPPSNNLKPGIDNIPNIDGNIQTNGIGITSNISSQTSSLFSIIEINPINDLKDLGYTSGEFNVHYNLFQNILSNSDDRALFIKEISQDRTEIRLASTTLLDSEIESVVTSMVDKINNSSYYVDYLLNFGDNKQYVAVNVVLNKVSTGYEILFKLYQPLPLEIQEKETLWVVEEKVNPYIFDINLDTLISSPPPLSLRGPNFNINTPKYNTLSTNYINYSTALNNLQSLQSSSYHNILNLINTQGISINVDYTDFNNFTFFGSVYKKVNNFYNKVKQIEDYRNLINNYTPYIASTSSFQTEINQYSSSINNIISQFDGYESFLYFESSSYSWPKSGSFKPYNLLSTGSATVTSWYNTLTGSALTYDNNNYDNLEYIVPNFIKDDSNNTQYLTFLNMVGQYFDNIWVYIKSITDINLANNNLNKGISKDLVYNQLQSLGIKLYNSQAGSNLDSYLIGANTGSNIFNDDFSITGSYLNNIPRKDLTAELYKRIYHNLPLLLKTKGTKTGLEYLISTFGIPSRTYITGSNTSSSILDIKEFGGSTKSNLIKGYNNEKVRIISNSITGSVISPLLSLQTYPTSSNNFRENDSHFIDISFSPETQINTYISSSIKSNNSTWNLDNYIGDPRQINSSSYVDLDIQRDLYFKTGVSGYSGFTGSLMDYNGFIRLIQYFDNSLFKMLEDFTPERTSLSTGVTIKSPVLERNKTAYSIPNIENQSVYDSNYSYPTMSAQYGNFYNNIGGNKMEYFNGELTGSNIDVYGYFEVNNKNPYLGDWNVYNSQHDNTESINMQRFLHSDYNVLLNNVSQSVTSRFRNKIEYIYGTTGSLTSSVELQDSYLNLKSYNNSRYDGTKLTSLNYNTYTSSSYMGSDGRTIQNGDKSYGKTAVINRNSYKLGWIQSIPTQSLNFYNKTPISLRYLINSDNELTELNSYNNNIFEVQNIFKSGKPTILSLSKPNQNRKDGEKQVWKGGYNYNPIIYRENGDTLTFIYDEYIATSSLPLGFLSTDINRYEYETDQLGGDASSPSSFIVNTPDINFFSINGVVSSTTSTGRNNLATDVISSNLWPYNDIPKLSYNDTTYDDANRGKNGPSYRLGIFNFNNFTTPQFTELGSPIIPPSDYTNIYSRGLFNEPILSSYMNDVYKVNRTGLYKIAGGTMFRIRVTENPLNWGWSKFKIGLVIETADENNYRNNIWDIYDHTGPLPTFSPIFELDSSVPNTGGLYGFNSSNNSIKLIDNYAEFGLNFGSNVGGPPILNLTEGTYVRLSFYFMDIQELYRYATNINLQFRNTYWGVYDIEKRSTEYIYESNYTSSIPIFSLGTTNTINDTLVFTHSSSLYFYSSSFSGSSTNYSEVINNFSVERGDLIKFGKFKDPGEYYEVYNSYITGSSPYYKVILTNSVVTSSANMSNDFAILRPRPDETSVILEGRKIIGREEIEKALLIPYDTSNDLNDNIGNIIKSVNTLI